MKPTSLVTGGAGFIGSHVVDHLIMQGHQVVVLDDLSGGNIENVHSEATFREGSILDLDLIQELFEEFNFSYVFHLAAYAAEGLSHFIRDFNYQNNLIGSVNLINASVNHDVKCFVFTSSIAVYGSNITPFSESMKLEPEDPYGIAKQAVELDLISAQRMFGMDYVIFRPHNVYGERQNIGDPYRNVVGIFMNQVLKQEALTIFGDGNQTRAFTHIDDVAPYIANSINVREARNSIFNIGSDDATTVNKLAKAVITAMRLEAQIEHVAERNEVVHAVSSHQKFDAIFKPNNRISLEDGLAKMAEWVKENGARTSQWFDHVEIPKNLPPIWRENALK